jgi:hypothetical protein
LTNSDPRVARALQWLTGEQCSDGGWQDAPRSSGLTVTSGCSSSGGDVVTTARAVVALRSLGRDTGSAQDFLVGKQHSDAGWGPGTSPSDAETTGLVLSALGMLGLDVDGPALANPGGVTPAGFLRGLQRSSGEFPAAGSGDALSAAGAAVPGLLGVGPPTRTVSFPPPPAAVTVASSAAPATTAAAAPVAAPPRAPACIIVVGRSKTYSIPLRCRPVAHPTVLHECRIVRVKGKKVARPQGCLPLRR